MFAKKPVKKDNVAAKFAIGAALTAVAGYVAGILTAPKSGAETREDLKNKDFETYSVAEKEMKKLHTELAEVLEQMGQKAGVLKKEGGKKLDEAVAKGKDAKEKARNVLSSLHEGEIDDKDLKKAIQEASKAVENLRNFLKK